MEERLVELDFSAAFNRVTHRGLLYKLMSIRVRRHFLFMVSEFLSDRRQRESLDGKVSAPVDEVSGVAQGSGLGSLLFISYTYKLIHILRTIS